MIDRRTRFIYLLLTTVSIIMAGLILYGFEDILLVLAAAIGKFLRDDGFFYAGMLLGFLTLTFWW